MTSTWLYRIAAILFAVFDAGHTYIFLTFKPPTAEGLAVLEAMNRVHFQMFGGSVSYGGLYIGFGLVATIYLAFSAYLAWHLSRLALKTPQAIGAIRWIFAGVSIAVMIVACAWFTGPPVWLTAAIAVCSTAAAFTLNAHV
jgi:hypothetical protein